MDLRQIEYISAIAEEQSISKAAEKLFITQSGLNQQLLKLEKELGTPLFERKKNNMVPTYAGQVYLDASRRIIDIKREAYKVIHDITNEDAGVISIAYTPEKGALMFAHVYPHFHERYPNVSFKIREGRAKDMEQMLAKREVDIAFCIHMDDCKPPQFEYIDLATEPIVLAMPSTHPHALMAGERSYETLPEIDIRLLKDTNFVLSDKSTRIRDISDALFRQAGFQPNVLFESTSTSTIVNMVKSQICCAFLPGSYIDPDAPVVYFSTIPSYSWTLNVTMRAGNYLTKPEQYLINLAKLYSHKQLPPFFHV